MMSTVRVRSSGALATAADLSVEVVHLGAGVDAGHDGRVVVVRRVVHAGRPDHVLHDELGAGVQDRQARARGLAEDVAHVAAPVGQRPLQDLLDGRAPSAVQAHRHAATNSSMSNFLDPRSILRLLSPRPAGPGPGARPGRAAGACGLHSKADSLRLSPRPPLKHPTPRARQGPRRFAAGSGGAGARSRPGAAPGRRGGDSGPRRVARGRGGRAGGGLPPGPPGAESVSVWIRGSARALRRAQAMRPSVGRPARDPRGPLVGKKMRTRALIRPMRSFPHAVFRPLTILLAAVGRPRNRPGQAAAASSESATAVRA